MPLSLSSNDCIRLEAALQTLLCPLDYPHVDAWRSAVNRLLRELLGADKAVFQLSIEGAALFYSDEYAPDSLQVYPHKLQPIGTRFSVWERAIRLKVCSRDMLWHPHLDEYYRSAYYNEYVVSIRGFDALTMTIALKEETKNERSMGVLYFHHEQPEGAKFGDRGLALLHLAYPAFKAGVESYLRFAEHRATFTRTLDALKEGLLLCDLTGRILHQNPALAKLLAADPERERLLQEMAKVARALVGLAWNPRSSREEITCLPAARDVRTNKARYRIRGSCMGGAHLSRESYVLVALERVVPELPSEAELRARFGLTRQEAHVALLLARRRRNEEIAEALCISPHTARHHTEKVLLKLGINSRDGVGPVLIGRNKPHRK